MSNRDFLQTVVSLLGEFRANGARRVVINFSGERDRQLTDGFVLNEDPARSEFYKAPEPKHPTFELLTFVLAKTVQLCPGQGTLIEFRLDNDTTRVGKRAIAGSAYRCSKPFPTSELHPGVLAMEA